MKYELEGKVLKVDETQTFASGFQKREFVVETEGKYPQEIKLETLKDDCDKLDKIREGDIVNVSFNIRGNEYNGKHYVNLVAWKLDVLRPSTRPKQTKPKQAELPASNDDDDELFPY